MLVVVDVFEVGVVEVGVVEVGVVEVGVPGVAGFVAAWNEPMSYFDWFC